MRLPLGSACLALAAAAALAACGGAAKPAAVGTPIDCSWLAGANCWKTSAAAATACTDGTTGAFDGPATTRCTYSDGTRVEFDPTWTATASHAQSSGFDDVWDFTVLTSTSATCADFHRDGSGLTLTTHLGTFTMSDTASGLLFTCPDGGRYALDGMTLLSCMGSLPGYSTGGTSPMTFALSNAGTSDSTLWRCQ